MQERDNPLRAANIFGPADESATHYKKNKKWIYLGISSFILVNIIIFGFVAVVTLTPSLEYVLHPSSESMNVSQTTNEGAIRNYGGFERLVFDFMFALIFLVMLYFASKAPNKSAIFMKQVSESLGFTYTKIEEVNTNKGALFSFGSNRYLAHVLTGNYNGIPARIYVYHVTTSIKKNNDDDGEEYAFTICEFTYPYNLPPILLNHKTLGQTLEQAISYKHADSISIDLEGDFDKYFNLKTKKGLETVAREIFTPDIMATLIDQKDRVNFESYGSQLYVYQLGFIGGKDAMSTFYENATTIATLLIPHFKETSSELAAKGTLEHV